MDSLRYWVLEMHVDGFRFDLAAALARSMHDVDMLGGFMTTIQQDPVLREVKLIAEPWDVGEGGYQVGEFPPLWTEWNDKYRDAVRDFWRGTGGGIRELGYRLSGSSDLYGDDGRRPFASINFVTAHDGFTLRDLVTYDRKHNEANGEGNRDGTDDNRCWNHGVEGETDDRVGAGGQAPAACATCWPRCCCPPASRCCSRATSWAAPSGATTTPTARTTRSPGWTGTWPGGRPTWWSGPGGCSRCGAAHPVLRHRHFLEGRLLDPAGRKDLAWLGPDGGELADADWWAPDAATFGMYLAGDGVPGRTARGEPIVDSSILLLLHAGNEPVGFTLPGPPWASGWRRLLDTATSGRSKRPGWTSPGSRSPWRRAR